MVSVRSLILGNLVLALLIAGGFGVAHWLINDPAIVSSGVVRPFSNLAKLSEPEEKWPFKPISLSSAASRAVIVMYHDVVTRRTRDGVWFDTTIDELRDDLDLIEKMGGTVVPLEQVYRALTDGAPLPEKAVVLTFDDGYVGFYENARPLLEERRAPATVFMHTAFIGDQNGKPKMTMAQLKEVDSSDLFDVQSHTVTHPEDITALDSERIRAELRDSRQKLEEGLGHEVRFLSWPVGKNDSMTRYEAQEAGYRMAVTMERGLVGDSPDILAVSRIVRKRLKESLEEMDKAPPALWAESRLDRSAGPELRDESYGRVKLLTVTGGSPQTVLVDGRRQVSDLVTEFAGVAGINGGFFSMAAIASTDNTMIGPCLAANRKVLIPDPETERARRVAMRPLVLIGQDKIAFVPFQPRLMNSESVLREAFEGLTDTFVAGAWLVVDGRPLDRTTMMRAATSDAQDARKRAFMGVTEDGRFIIGASKNGATSEKLAEAAAAAGAHQAVLLDSGFSTSLVYRGKILAWGHRSSEHGSRPIPHAIVISEPTSQGE
ncbi:MAG: polysaccharide deacetylase family protein [Fimbriimonadaceae bacterium]|nr:polysaccharide deacetylase family protein [Fimbriimonadaceae bacterium]QYK58883.1 MAG: polysaccharide deacetylase family protein [Fimbriimonadaceae bacterium]